MGLNALLVKGRALRYLAQREHSRAELERKLARVVSDLPPADAQAQIQSALDDLAAKGLLSEQRTAQSVLLSQGRRFGLHRLRQTLQAKGLPGDLVASTLQQAQATEFERALEVWRRKFGRAPADAAERAKQMRFMVGRGFEAEVVQRLVQSSEDE